MEDENLENSIIFPDMNNGDISGCFEKCLQSLIIRTVGEGKKRTLPAKKQIQIAFQETELQPQFQVRPTTINILLISNNSFCKQWRRQTSTKNNHALGPTQNHQHSGDLK